MLFNSFWIASIDFICGELVQPLALGSSNNSDTSNRPIIRLGRLSEISEAVMVGEDCILLGTSGGFVAGEHVRPLDGVVDKLASISGCTRNRPCLRDDVQAPGPSHGFRPIS